MKFSIRFILAAACASLACGSDGNDGINYLVDVQDEPAGDNCAAGGSAIATGPDSNGNGTLDADEVADVSYVCGTGSTSADQLVSIDAEAAGENCPSGGVAINIGTDGDGNGTLESGEISSTTYVCDPQSVADAFGGVLPGNITVSNPLALAVLSQFSEVEGDLEIDANALAGATSIDLRNLTTVGGDLTFPDGAGLESLNLSGLTSVGGSLGITDAGALTSLDLSSLATAGALKLENSGDSLALALPALTAITTGDFDLNGGSYGAIFAPLLATVEGAMRVRGGATTGNLGFPALGEVRGEDGVRITGGSSVGAVNLSALTTTPWLSLLSSSIQAIDFTLLATVDIECRVDKVDTLTSLSFPALTVCGDPGGVNGNGNDFEITDNSALTSLSAPLLATVGDGDTNDDFLITGNAMLTSLSFGALATVTGAFDIANNDLLLCSQVTPILSGLSTTPDSVDISGNDQDCTP